MRGRGPPAGRGRRGRGLGLLAAQWLQEHSLRPRIVGESDDSALLKVFGQTGGGVFCAPAAIEDEVRQQHGAKVIGRVATIRERFYAIAVERCIENPALMAISEVARRDLFA